MWPQGHVRKLEAASPDEEVRTTDPLLNAALDFGKITKGLKLADDDKAKVTGEDEEVDGKQVDQGKKGAHTPEAQERVKAKDGGEDDKKVTAEASKPDGLGKMLLVFYLGYNAVPAIVSKQFVRF